jgi:hypothetical protein
LQEELGQQLAEEQERGRQVQVAAEGRVAAATAEATAALGTERLLGQELRQEAQLANEAGRCATERAT